MDALTRERPRRDIGAILLYVKTLSKFLDGMKVIQTIKITICIGYLSVVNIYPLCTLFCFIINIVVVVVVVVVVLVVVVVVVYYSGIIIYSIVFIIIKFCVNCSELRYR